MKIKSCFVLAIFLIITSTLLALPSVIQKDNQTKSFPVKKGGLLEVSVDVGDILITTWEKNEVFVMAEGVDEEYDLLRMTQTGNNVYVKYRSDGWSHGHRVRFEINVPSQFDVNLDTSGGDIDIRGALTGNLEGSTSGGNIMIDDVNGQVEMTTSGGNVSAGKLRGDALLETSGGNIKVEAASSKLEVFTSGGNITVGDVGRMLKAKTSGGNITIGDVGGEATASTAGGNIELGKVVGEASLNTAGGDIELGGANGMIIARTAGGDLTLENLAGAVEAKTAGGDVYVELIPSGKDESRLTTAGGEISLYVPEDSKASINACIRIHGRWGRWERRDDDYEIYSDFKAKTYDKDTDSGEICGTYILNGGGQDISLDTVNANIQIRKWRPRGK